MTEQVDLFYGTSGPRSAEIAIVGEAWGSEEERLHRPFVGESGRELDKMLAEAGITREECFCTNLVSARPPRNEFTQFLFPTKEAKASKQELVNGLALRPIAQEGLDKLARQLAIVRPSLIIACGNYPFWAFSSNAKISNSGKPSGYKVPAGITTWRGSQLVCDRIARNTRLLPIIHPAAIVRQWYLRAITVHDLRVRGGLARKGSWAKPVYNAIAPPLFHQATSWLLRTLHALEATPTEIMVDLETDRYRVIACIGLARSRLEALCIPFIRPTSGGGTTPWWTFTQEVELVKLLRAVLNHPNAILVGQNFAYDIQYLGKWWNIRRRLGGDTMINQHVMFPGTPKTLGYLASLYADDYYSYWKEDSKDWKAEGDITKHLLYNCDDCIYTWIIYQSQKDAIIKMGLTEQVKTKVEEWHLAVEMMERGVLLDKRERGGMTLRVAAAAYDRQERLQRMVPEFCRPPTKKGAAPFYNSPPQQHQLLYEMLGLKSVHHRKTGNITVNDEALHELKLRYPYLTRLFDTILELRSLGVFANNYLSAAVDPDGRWRTSFNVAGPETMRWSSSENAFGRGVNLQNLSTGTEE